MRKIVDPSFLRHPDLEKYFREDLGNQVVFSDYACMESYKGDSLKNLQQSLKTVAAWPDRVIVLKGTRDIIRIQTNPRHVIDDFIDTEQTSEFRQFFGQLNEVAQGNVVLAQRMRTLTEIAHKHFERMRADAAGVAEAIGCGDSYRGYHDPRVSAPRVAAYHAGRWRPRDPRRGEDSRLFQR